MNNETDTSPARLAFLSGFNLLRQLPAQGGDTIAIEELDKTWWNNVKGTPWITPQTWVAACEALQKDSKWRPVWEEIEFTCLYFKEMFAEEGVKTLGEAERQRAERAQTLVENRPGRDTPVLPPPPEKRTAREVRRATVLRHAAIGRARIRKRNALIAAYCKAQGMALGHCAVPDEAWKGQDEPTPEEIAAEMQRRKPEATAAAVYRAIRPGESRPLKVGWGRIGEDGEPEPGDHYVDVRKPDPPSPATVKERERVMAEEPKIAPYNEREFRRDHPRVNPVAPKGQGTWPRVPVPKEVE